MNRSDEKPEMSSLRKYPMRFLKWLCPDHLYEEIEGDLIQRFDRDIKLFGDDLIAEKSITLTMTNTSFLSRGEDASGVKETTLIQD